MILEGIVTTRDEAGTLNVAPMGPIVDDSMSTLHLRPFRTSQTYRNLCGHPQGVFHVVDDVLLLAEAAIGQPLQNARVRSAVVIDGSVLEAACRWYEFQIERTDQSGERSDLYAKVVHVGRIRDFFGFNRAKHAVVEAAILATRVHFLEREELLRQFEALSIPVQKTAGERERKAFELLRDYVRERTAPQQ